jgi:hypothetical protein
MTSSVAVPEPGALSTGTDGSMQGRTAATSAVTGFNAASMSETTRSSRCSATRPMPARTTASLPTRVAWRNSWSPTGMAVGPLVRTPITSATGWRPTDGH